MYAENPKQFNKTYRIQIAHTEQEIDTIIWMGVFCSDKTGFVRPGHKFKIGQVSLVSSNGTYVSHWWWKGGAREARAPQL